MKRREEATGLNGVVGTVAEPPTCRTRVLFALSEADRERFLPGRNVCEEVAADSCRVDVSRLGAEEWQRLLFEADPEILVTAWDTPPLPEAYVRREGLSLRYVCHVTGGVKSLFPRFLIERGVMASNWGSAISHTIAEHALLLTLGALRNLPQWGATLKLPELPPRRIFDLRVRSLRGRRVGLHGFGAVARELVRLLKPFQVEISSYSHGVPEALFEEWGVLRRDSLEDLFSHSDVLIECEALTPYNQATVTRGVLALLPVDAVFVNVGRGAVVDEAALAALAGEGKIRVAADVFTRESPLDSPLLHIPGALLSPHIAGPTGDVFHRCGDFAMENLRRFLHGRPVEGLITLEVYDRAG